MESEPQVRSVLHAAAGTAQLSLDGAFLNLNDHYCQILGYSREELRGKALTEITHPADLAAELSLLGRLRSGEIPSYSLEKRYIRKDGAVVWVHLLVSPLRNPDGRMESLFAVANDVTERKAATEQAERAREHLLLAAQSAGLASWERNVTTGHLLWSDEMHSLFGVDRAVADPYAIWLERIHAADRSRVVASHQACQRDGAAQVEYRYQAPGRPLRWFTGSYRMVSGERMLAICLDTTERKSREDELRRGEELFRDLADSIPQLAWMAAGDGAMFWYNRRWYDYTGTTLGEMQGWGWQKVHDPRHLSRVLTRWKSCLAAGTTWEDTFPLRAANGTYRWFLSRATPIRDAAGTLTRWFGTNTDITDRLEAENRLRASEERFRRLYESNIVGIVSGENNRITDANNVFLAMVGYTREELQAGRLNLSEMTPPEHHAADQAAIQTLLDRGSCPPYEKENYCKDGSRVPFLIGATLLERIPFRWLGFTLDLTERKQLERRVLESQKLESVGLLAGGIAHDFNNLLVGVIGAASLAQELLPPDHAAADHLVRILRAGQSAAHLTRQMLAYAGKGQFVVESLDLSVLFQELARLVLPSISKKIRLDLQLGAGLPSIEADRGHAQQMFLNLVLNAAEAIGDNAGTITVRTFRFDASGDWITRELASEDIAAGSYAGFEVQDTGCGMDDNTRKRIFDPFFTTKFTGRGLGLAAVAGIVRSHHGAIQVWSEPGQGSTFRILLPAAGRVDTTVEPAAAVEAAAPRGNATVLVVDDEEVVRKVARLALERFGYRTLEASSGDDALAELRRHPDIDLVLLDLSMPGLSGREAVPAIRALRPNLRILVTSGYAEQETMPLFEDCDIAGFIQKPYTSHRLAEKVQAALDAGGTGRG